MGAPKICKPPKVNFIGSAHNSSAGHLRQMPTLRLRCAYSFASALPSVSSQAQLKSFSRARGCVLYEDHARPPHPGCCATADRRSRWASYDAMSCMLFGPPAHCACAAHCGAADRVHHASGVRYRIMREDGACRTGACIPLVLDRDRTCGHLLPPAEDNDTLDAGGREGGTRGRETNVREVT